MIPIDADTLQRRVDDSRADYDFSNYYVKGDLSLNLKNARSIILNGSTFENNVTIYSEQTISIHLNDVTINGHCKVQLKRATIDCKNSNLNKGFSISGNDGLYLDFQNTKATGKFNISECKISNANFEDFTFVSETSTDEFLFQKNEVTGEALFNKSLLHNACFNDSTFARYANFDNSKFTYSVTPGQGNFFNVEFKLDAYFNNTIFDNAAFFNGSKFHGSALFIRNNNKDVRCIGDFSGVTFHKRAFFDMTTFDNVVFKNCEFVDVASFKDFHCNYLEISKAIFLKGVDFLNVKIENADRETFRIIKSEFLKINNQVEALRYRSKEMIAYEKELTKNKLSSEYLLLYLNKISNYHGLSWLRGLKFTFLVGILGYLLYLLTLKTLPFIWGWKDWSSFIEASGVTIKYFVRFFIPTHDLDFMESFHPSALSFIVDFISKVFIGYGIYQTIQAFRKFGKG